MARSTSGRFVPGTSGNPAGRRTKVATNQERADGWINSLTAVGDYARDKSMRTTFASDVVDYDTAMDMWRGDDIAARIVETIPGEATREGYEIVLADEKPPPAEVHSEVAQGYAAAGMAWAASAMAKAAARQDSVSDPAMLESEVEAELRTLKVDEHVRMGMCFERALGGGAILLGVTDFSPDLREPLDLTAIKALTWMTTLEARELQPVRWYNDPFSPKFGMPEIWRLVPITTAGGIAVPMVEIHESRLIIFGGVRVTKRPLYGVHSGWGDNVFTRTAGPLRDFNGSHRAAAILLSDFSQAVYKIRDLAATIATDGRGSLVERMTTIDLGRSIARAILVDSEEDFERKATPMSGFAETLDRLAARLAAAVEMPLTLLMGQSPGGLNATGASDTRFFYDRVAAAQKRVVTPAVRRIVDILFAIRGLPPGSVDYTVEHKPLWQETDKERAEARSLQAGIDEKYINMGVATPDEIALSRFGGDTYSYETKLDFEARAAQAALPPAPAPVPPAPTAQPVVLLDQTAAEPVQAEPPRFDAYDPDQPRGPDGKWGEGDGATGARESAEKTGAQATALAKEAGAAARTARGPDKAIATGARTAAEKVAKDAAKMARAAAKVERAAARVKDAEARVAAARAKVAELKASREAREAVAKENERLTLTNGEITVAPEPAAADTQTLAEGAGDIKPAAEAPADPTPQAGPKSEKEILTAVREAEDAHAKMLEFVDGKFVAKVDDVTLRSAFIKSLEASREMIAHYGESTREVDAQIEDEVKALAEIQAAAAPAAGPSASAPKSEKEILDAVRSAEDEHSKMLEFVGGKFVPKVDDATLRAAYIKSLRASRDMIAHFGEDTRSIDAQIEDETKAAASAAGKASEPTAAAEARVEAAVAASRSAKPSGKAKKK
jgi:phage-related protein (TIGR01555 family)